MSATRASYSIESAVLSRFNELFPSSTRSRVVQSLMEKALGEQHKTLVALAREAETHADFEEARAAGRAFESTASGDGIVADRT